MDLTKKTNVFLDNNNFNVLLVDGVWGIGKTTSVLKSDLKKKAKIISLISLSFDDILKELFSEDYNVMVELLNYRTYCGLSLGATVLGSGGSFSVQKNNKKRVLKEPKSNFKAKNLKKKKIIIFDDVEHYKGDPKELIRIINSLKKIDGKFKFIIIGNFGVNNSSEENKKIKEDFLRISEKLDCQLVTVNNRQWDSCFDEDFKRRILDIEEELGGGFFYNMRILNYMYKKYKGLLDEEKSLKSLNNILIKTYIDRMSDTKNRDEFIEKWKIKEKRNINFMPVSYIHHNYKNHWESMFWSGTKEKKLMAYFQTDLNYQEYQKEINENLGSDYINEFLMSYENPNSKFGDFNAKKFFDCALERAVANNSINLKKNPYGMIFVVAEFIFQKGLKVDIFNNEIINYLEEYLENEIAEEELRLEWKKTPIEIFNSWGKLNKDWTIGSANFFINNSFVEEYLEWARDIFWKNFLEIKEKFSKKVQTQIKDNQIENKVIKLFTEGRFNNITKFSIDWLGELDSLKNEIGVKKMQEFIFSFIINQKNPSWKIFHFIEFFRNFLPILSEMTEKRALELCMDYLKEKNNGVLSKNFEKNIKEQIKDIRKTINILNA